MIEIKNNLLRLSELSSAGYVTDAAAYAEEELSKYCEVERVGNTVTASLCGESDYKLLIDAHIDEISFVVTNVDDEGFVTVAKAGGIDLRALPCQLLDIHGKQRVTAVFCSTPPHLKSGEKKYEDIGELRLDTLLGEKAGELISLGDIATLHRSPEQLLNNRISGKSLDNRAGVAVILELARRLAGKKLPFNVTFLLSDQEELGLRGAKTAAFRESPDEAIVIDVSFAVQPSVSSDEAGEMGKGAMIGVSPSLSGEIYKRLKSIAEQNKIPYQLEVMGGSTGTNADVISLNKSGVKASLISIPLRNMHSAVEVVDISDIMSTADIIEKYILSGGKA